MPRATSSRRRPSTISEIFSSPGSTPDGVHLGLDLAAIFLRETSTKGARCVSEMDCPPYWHEATCAMICVAMLQAVEKLCGRSMSVPEMTVPFCSMSSRFTRSQLCMCWAK